jgi:hypothetical protein
LAIKNSVYVLPYNEKTHEDFQWLKQEIEASGGEASVFRAGAVEGATDDEITASFRRARDEDYERVAAELDGLVGIINEQRRGGHLSPARISANEAELEKLHAELDRIVAVDFFGAPQGKRAVAAFERCRQALSATQKKSRRKGKGKGAVSREGPLSVAEYQGKRWVTRRNLHIDRLASAWLIKRFIDARPRFHFVSEGEQVEEGIAFDMFGAEFTHHGDDCTLETMLKGFGFEKDAALREIAEIVHDIDLKDGKFSRLEAAGLNTTVRGLAAHLNDDRKLLGQCQAIFDGLYVFFSESGSKGKRERIDGSGKTGRKRAGERRKPRRK